VAAANAQVTAANAQVAAANVQVAAARGTADAYSAMLASKDAHNTELSVQSAERKPQSSSGRKLDAIDLSEGPDDDNKRRKTDKNGAYSTAIISTDVGARLVAVAASARAGGALQLDAEADAKDVLIAALTREVAVANREAAATKTTANAQVAAAKTAANDRVTAAKTVANAQVAAANAQVTAANDRVTAVRGTADAYCAMLASKDARVADLIAENAELKSQASGRKRNAIDLSSEGGPDDGNKRRKTDNNGAGSSSSSSSSLSRQVINAKDQRLVKVKEELSDARGSARTEGLRADRAEDQTKCTICYDNDREVCFLPCSHMVTCFHCSEAVQDCPMCRQFYR
jgi:hypothetical protein